MCPTIPAKTVAPFVDPQLSIQDYYGGSRGDREIRKSKPGAEIAHGALLRVAPVAILAASIIWFSQSALSPPLPNLFLSGAWASRHP
jgi:hypothetical protein